MANKVIKFLGGREGEQKRMTLLLFMGFFMGVFLATLQVPAETLITALGEEYLDVAFFVGGGLGVVSALIYVAAQRRISFSRLVILNTILIAAATLGLRMSFYYYDHRIASFVLFVMMGPLSSITLLSFWGIFGRIFDVRSSKRIIGGIDTGQLSATCLAFFAITIISEYINTLDILWISSISSVGIFVLAVQIVSSYNLDKDLSNDLATVGSKEAPRKKARSQIGYADLLSNKYFLMMALFLVFSVCASKFNEFGYRTAMFTWYSSDETALNKAYSLIDAIIIVVSFLVQSFINDYIIGKYGLKISLMVMPILLGLFTVGAIVAGHVFGYDLASGNFFIFFTFMVMGRILTASLRDALENPAFKMFFFPVDERDRFDVQSRIEGVVNEFAALSAGAVLIGLGMLKFFDIIQASYLLLILVVGAVYMSAKLFDQYKITLKSSLLQQKKKLQGRNLQSESSVISILTRNLQNKQKSSTPIFTLKLMEHMEPMLLRKSILQTLRSPFAEVRLFAYKKCVDINNMEHLEEIQNASSSESNPKVSEIAEQTVSKISRSKRHNPTETEFSEMLRSRDPKARKYAAQLLTKFPGGRYGTFLIELLRDVHPEVRRSAIVSAGLLKVPDYWSSIIGSLHIPSYANTCRSALISCGKAVYQTVDMLFYRTNQHPNTMFRVVQILGRLGGPEGVERLWKKIDYPNKKIFDECLFSMSYNAYRVRDTRSARLRIQLDEAIGTITWNMRVLINLPKKHPVDVLLTSAVEEENQQHQSDLFMIMAMVYDPQSVQLVKENVDFGTPESLTYAIELMNIFLDETLKPKMFPLFDDLQPEECISRLSSYYTPESFKGHEDTLLQIINRDYKCVSRWAKGLAIYRLASLSSAKITPDLLANIFNPDMLLLQTAAFVLYKKDKHEYRRQTLRIESKVAKQLDTVLLPPVHLEEGAKWNRPLLLIERAIFFKRVPAFSDVRGTTLTELSELARERSYKAEQTILRKGDKGGQPVRILLRGRIKKHHQENIEGYMEMHDVIGLRALVPSDTYQYDYTAVEPSVCLEIELDNFFSLIGIRIELMKAMMKYVQEGGREKQEEKIEQSIDKVHI